MLHLPFEENRDGESCPLEAALLFVLWQGKRQRALASSGAERAGTQRCAELDTSTRLHCGAVSPARESGNYPYTTTGARSSYLDVDAL